MKVNVFVYDKDGNLVSSTYLTYTNFTNSNTELAANSSAYLQVVPPGVAAVNFGKAIIEWENLTGNDDTVALVAHAIITRISAGGDARLGVPVNGGAPF